MLAGLVALPQAARASQLEVPCSQHTDPRLASMTDTGITLASSVGLPPGRFALPATTTPTILVVMFHGHGNDSCSWRGHLQEVAARGAVGVAMDYTGQRQTPVENYGWFVREGATDSIKAAKYFLQRFPTIKTVIAFGISMGGNSSGIAVARDPLRSNGKPLFDYWIDVEGVNNLVEEYLVARAVGVAGNSSGALAQQEIEEENGGPLEAVPGKYLEITNVLQAHRMGYLKGAVVINAVDDGLVPTDQSPQMTAALTAAGVKTHMFTVIGNGGAEDGTTASSIVAGPVFAAVGQQYTSPFAGHGWEGSDTQLVIKTGLDQLFALMAGGHITRGETVVPGL
jgi:pimeloyl-ACP methyl ester carboxylesterase